MSAAKRARTTPTTSCKWGFISTGGIANDFALALKATPHAERYAVASRTQAAADEFKATHGFSKAYDSYEKLVADPEIDVIYIATPHAFHRDNILMCLDAGKNVVCEKPMVVNAKQAEECIAKAKEKGLFLMEGMWTRFFPATRAVRKLVKDGAIGKVVSMHASLGFKGESHFNARLFKPELAGGALFDVGIYPSMWIAAILGVPSKVTAHARMHEEGVDAMTFATYEFDDYPDCMAQMQCGFTGTLANEVIVIGETGRIRVHGPPQCPETYTLTQRQGDEPDPLLTRGKVTTVSEPLDPPHFGNAPGYNFVGSQGFAYEAAAVQEALAKGLTEHPEMPLSETLGMAKIFDEVRKQIGLTYPWD